MIHKDWQPSIYLRQLRALHRRLPANHPKYPQVKDELNRYSAGYKGEEVIKYQLSMLNPDIYHIFHDIRLPVGEHFFQIDILVLAGNMILIIEVKNMTGSLFFDHVFHQLIRTQDGKEEGFPDPILQLNRQQLLFGKWLINERVTDQLPVIPLLTVSNPQTIIKSSSKEYQDIISHRNFLPIKIQQLQHKHPTIHLSNKQLKKLTKKIMTQNFPHKSDILPRFGVKPDEIRKGVHCPVCGQLPLLYQKAKWHCSKCEANQE